ncbi:MAG: sugar phosphate isomerase/epimerase [Verrucomicrobia bacterium]|nr:sugar phosphate isomerase/epimerase [Verrucomicrobiota bacterium]
MLGSGIAGVTASHSSPLQVPESVLQISPDCLPFCPMASLRPCLNASTLRGTPVLDQIRAAARAGFRALELWYDDTDAHRRRGGSLEEIRHALEDAGLEVPTLIYLGGWFEAQETAWPAVRDACARRLEEAAALGAAHVIAGPPVGHADVRTGALRYRELLELGDRIGVAPAFEFLGFMEQFRTVTSALEVIALAGHPRAATVVDPFHLVRGGGSMDDVARLTARQIAIAHFNDLPAGHPVATLQDADRVWPGDGCLDLRRYRERLREVGYEGWLSLELFREDLWRRDPFEVARIARERLEPWLD